MHDLHVDGQGFVHDPRRHSRDDLLQRRDVGEAFFPDATGVEVWDLDLDSRGNLSGDLVEQLG